MNDTDKQDLFYNRALINILSLQSHMNIIMQCFRKSAHMANEALYDNGTIDTSNNVPIKKGDHDHSNTRIPVQIHPIVNCC